MVRRSLIAVGLLAIAAPLSAQSVMSEPEVWMWDASRPDAFGPVSLFGARTNGAGELAITYRYNQANSKGIWFDTDSVPLVTTLRDYNDAPLALSDVRHQLVLSYGVSDALTVVARAEFASLERETAANGSFIRTGVQALGDFEVGALYNVYADGPYRLHVHAGAIVPGGSTRTYADTTMAQSGTEVAMPYDMRPGAGTLGATFGMTGGLQNEIASIGAQLRVRTNFGENGSEYRVGDRTSLNTWASYVVNPQFSVFTGVRYEHWGSISGQDPELMAGGDPYNVGAFLGGQRVQMPFGFNFLMPTGSTLEGHRLSVESLHTLHHDYEGFQFGLDWVLTIGWTVGL